MGSEEQNKLQEKRRVAEKQPMPFPLKGKADTNMLFIKTRVFCWGKIRHGGRESRSLN